MKRVQGSADIKLLECVSPARKKWRIRWDVKAEDGGRSATYMEEDFDHQPSKEESKGIITKWYNSETRNKIESGFLWNGHRVWLTNENQLNYKFAYDLAVQTNGKNLPVTFKFDENFYQDFSALEDLQEFYLAFTSHVQQCINEGWKKKDSVDYNMYSL